MNSLAGSTLALQPLPCSSGSINSTNLQNKYVDLVFQQVSKSNVLSYEKHFLCFRTLLLLYILIPSLLGHNVIIQNSYLQGVTILTPRNMTTLDKINCKFLIPMWLIFPVQNIPYNFLAPRDLRSVMRNFHSFSTLLRVYESRRSKTTVAAPIICVSMAVLQRI